MKINVWSSNGPSVETLERPAEQAQGVEEEVEMSDCLIAEEGQDSSLGFGVAAR
jgi:hypothetical protein